MSIKLSNLPSRNDPAYKADFLSRVYWQKLKLKNNSLEELWQNFKRILEQNNQDVLKRKPLTENEFKVVRNRISNLSSPFKAGQFLYGVNGVSQIDLVLDDGRAVMLTVFNQHEVGAGNSVYQVVHGLRRPPVKAGKPERIFDTTLLINGLPIIQIEEKPSTCEVDQALNLMHQYIKEGLYTDIFSTLQILVGMTPNGIKYMANTTADKFNKDFAFFWQRDDFSKNRDPLINSWHEFATTMLSIPFVHLMATNYMILDAEQNQSSLKVMRPYQVYATIKAIKAIRKYQFGNGYGKLGYIWHTTGSGKTITSFKTAWLASRLVNVHKVVFVVDRVALTQQTLEKYRAYDPSLSPERPHFSSVFEASNISNLEQRLKTKDSKIIITTLQKLQRLVKREGFEASKLNTVFIVDEAHRSTGSELFAEIQDKFPYSAWLGYTGTPCLKATPGQSKTTEEIFGPLLHQYVVNDAIRDNNVLGFKVDFKATVPYNQQQASLLSELRKQHPRMGEERLLRLLASKNSELMDETQVDASFYNLNLEHVQAVVADIFANWQNRSNNGTFSAILTTTAGGVAPSAPMAALYYQEFKRVNKQRQEQGLPTLKVAMTYSDGFTENESIGEATQALDEAIADYNQLFATAHSREEIGMYFTDVMDRIAKRSFDQNYLDLVIVIDQLLTGFDAPKINTLYIDRSLRGANLVQAYSRTNRIYNMLEKPFGNIVHYRWPDNSREEMVKALATYAVGKMGRLSSERLYEQMEQMQVVAPSFKESLKTLKKTVKDLRKLTQDFTSLPATSALQELMLEKIRNYTNQLVQIKQYDKYPTIGGKLRVVGFDYQAPESLFSKLKITSAEEQQLMLSLRKELLSKIASSKGVETYEIDSKVTLIKEVPLSFDYLGELFAKYINLRQQLKEAKLLLEAQSLLTVKVIPTDINPLIQEFLEVKQDLDKYLENMRDKDAVAYRQSMNALNVINQDIYPLPQTQYPIVCKEASEIIHPANETYIMQKINNFRAYWGIESLISADKIRQIIGRHTYKNFRDLNTQGDLNHLLKEAQAIYKTTAAQELRDLFRLDYRNNLRIALYELADEVVSY
ncbi:HsdR family type I site-specific deoxyribonuclease [Psittacicella gerlachiana]|uniref:Type I restriction enzyme endonuclease subunit n=1 Tax=Psittacicella gerlachiana TaxID=2028574 RepID=A0A3A1YK83_9GAMM|nr:HsdR family type I site-specific deoxyribonuclease [Psittacicella gerlachiana]RIY36447.1 hypothetical protein CKF59_02680 [Psittacicella gerlachiana]